MLLDTNLRHSASGALRGYIHLLRQSRPGRSDARLRAAAAFYERVEAFVAEHDLRSRYMRSRRRFQSLAIQVRNDLVWSFEDNSPLEAPLPDAVARADYLGEAIAGAIAEYLEGDAPVSASWDDSGLGE